MALTITNAEDDEVTEFLNRVLTAYRNGWCSLEDARGSLWQILDAAIKDRPNFMGEVRGHTMMYLRDA